MMALPNRMNINPSMPSQNYLAPTSGAKTLIRACTTQEFWKILGWEDHIAIIHPKQCKMCTTYASHLMDTTSTYKIKLPNQDIREAVDTAWPWITRSIQCCTRECLIEESHDLKEEVEETKNKVNDLEDALVDQHAKNKNPRMPFTTLKKSSSRTGRLEPQPWNHPWLAPPHNWPWPNSWLAL